MNDDIEQLLSVGIKKELKLYVDMPNIYIDTVVWFIPLCYNLTVRINKFCDEDGHKLSKYIHLHIRKHEMGFNQATFYALLAVHNRSTALINDHFFERQL